MKTYIFCMLTLGLLLGCSDELVESNGGATGNASTDGKNDTVIDGEDGTDPTGTAGESVDPDELNADGGMMGEEVVDPLEGDDPTAMDASVVEEVDPFAEALDVNKHRVEFPEGTEAPNYTYPRADGFRLSGTEFWQKWEGGQNPTYSYGDGSEAGKRCMFASARRFEAIMENPPESLIALKENSNWGGSFFNWNDDFTDSGWGDGRSARLWAWRTGLIKWISQTNQDGSCYLPTLDMVEDMAESCGERAESRDGEIQGCSAS